jgi:hypothetical protein
MLYTIKQDLDLCIEFKINAAQLMFVKMLVPNLSLNKDEARKEGWALAMKFRNELGGIPLKDLEDLILREVIIDHNDMGKTLYEYYEINPKFFYKFSLKIYPIVDELHDAYPDFIYDASGKKFVAKGCSPQEISIDYLKAINNSPEEHQKVIEDINWGKQNNAIVMGLKKFVAAKYWTSLRELRNKTESYKTHSNVRVI